MDNIKICLTTETYRVGTAPFLFRVQKVLASKSVGSVAVVKGGIRFSMTSASKCDSTLKWATTASFRLIALSSFIVVVSSYSLIWLLFCKKGGNPQNTSFTGETRNRLRFTYYKCFEREDIPHLSWLSLKMALSSFYIRVLISP